VIATVNSGSFVVGLILGAVLGVIIMQAANNFAKKFGRPPWGIPPPVWFVFGLILGVIGVALYVVAHFTSKAKYTRNAGMTSSYGSPEPPYPPQSYPPQSYPPPSYQPPQAPPIDAPTWAPPSTSVPPTGERIPLPPPEEPPPAPSN
jgi:MFS family permease